jgi:hypothetical protein
MGKKKNNHEVVPSEPTDEKQRFSVPFRTSIAWLFYVNWMPCDDWCDLQLPGG